MTPLHVGHTTTAAAGSDPANLLPFLLAFAVGSVALGVVLAALSVWKYR